MASRGPDFQVLSLESWGPLGHLSFSPPPYIHSISKSSRFYSRNAITSHSLLCHHPPREATGGPRSLSFLPPGDVGSRDVRAIHLINVAEEGKQRGPSRGDSAPWLVAELQVAGSRGLRRRRHRPPVPARHPCSPAEFQVGPGLRDSAGRGASGRPPRPHLPVPRRAACHPRSPPQALP